MGFKKICKEVANSLLRRPKKQSYLEKLVEEIRQDGRTIDKNGELANLFHESQYISPTFEISSESKQTYPIGKTKLAVVMAAVTQYMESEKSEYLLKIDKPAKLSRWQRATRKPTHKNTYPLLRFHYH